MDLMILVLAMGAGRVQGTLKVAHAISHGIASMIVIETRLECEHVKHWDRNHSPPRLGDRVYCDRCDDMRVIQSMPGTWYAACLGCRTKIRRMSLESVRDNVVSHIRESGHPMTLSNHDGTERYTVRTTHNAASVGSHSASVPTKTRVLPTSRHLDTLFDP